MSEIPDDVMETAREVYDAVVDVEPFTRKSLEIIALAIVAERDRCASSLEQLTNDTIRLHMGEMSAQEMRTVRAFIIWQAAAIRTPRP